MQTPAAELPQKTCTYCHTVAEPRAKQCANCGSALPLVLPAIIPRPVARMVEAQAKWSMGKTAVVSILVSLTLGAAYNVEALSTGLIGVLIGFWLLFFLPGMLLVSAFVHGRSDAGVVVLNLLAAVGLWVLGIMLSIIAIVIY